MLKYIKHTFLCSFKDSAAMLKPKTFKDSAAMLKSNKPHAIFAFMLLFFLMLLFYDVILPLLCLYYIPFMTSGNQAVAGVAVATIVYLLSYTYL